MSSPVPDPATHVAELTAKNAQLEAELRHSKALFEQLADNLEHVLWLTDQNHQEVLYVSAAYETIWGQPRSASMQAMWGQWINSIHPEDLPKVQTALAELPGNRFDVNYRILRPDGSIRWIWDRGFPIYDAEGRIFQIAGIGEDITEQVHHEAARRQAEQRLQTLNQELEHRIQQRTAELETSQKILQLQEEAFRTLAEHSPDIIIRRDRDLRCTYINPAIKRYGIDASMFLGKTIEELDFPINLLTQWQTVFDRVLATGQPQTLDTSALLPSGLMTFQSLIVPEVDAEGKIMSTLAVTRDVTAFKQTESGLRHSEERFRRIFEDSPIGMGMASEAGQFLMANQRLCDITGYSPDEMLSLTFWDITHPEDRYKEFELLQSILQGRNERMTIEKRYIRKDKTEIWVQITVSLIKGDVGELQYQLGMVEDVSDRKVAEAQLKASLHEKEILLKEIHHRVKNNMQTVSSLLSLQASYIEDPEILAPFTESQNRVKAMALIHERLYRSESLGKVSFPEYVHKLVTDLVNSYQFRTTAVGLEFDVANVELDIDIALPCGLIVNELVSNALKHAFPENRSGTIRIRLTHTDSNNYLLSVSDNGIGIPLGITPYNSDSLGLQLISAFTKKLRGQVNVERGVGSTVIVMFSLPN